MMRKNKENSISVRLEAEQKEHLQDVALKIGMKPADIIRMAINQFLEQVEKEGRVVVPLRPVEDRMVAEDKKKFTTR